MAEYTPPAVSELARRIVGTEDQQTVHTPQLAYSSIEGGSIDEYDDEGTLSSVLGEQWDGTHAAVSYAGPKPPQPSAPQLTSGPLSLTVRWNGLFAGGVLSPMDFSHIEVHVSSVAGFEPMPSTLKTTLRGELGDQSVISPLTVSEWFVKFVARSLPTKASPPSVEVAATPDEITDSVAAGKITVEDYAPTLADGEGKPLNATWSQIDPATGAQVAFFRWDGAAWQDMPLSETIIPAINIGTGVYGTLKGVNLGADTFKGAVITGAIMQTQEESFRGLKLDSTTNTLTAYNPSGLATVTVDGNLGELTATGTFRTGLSGSRVEITREESSGLGGLDALIKLHSETTADYGVLLARDGEVIPGIEVVSETMLHHQLGDTAGGGTLSLSDARVNMSHRFDSGRRSGELDIQRNVAGLYHRFDGDPTFLPILSDVELRDDYAVLRKRSTTTGDTAADVLLKDDLAQLATWQNGAVDAAFYCNGGWAALKGRNGVWLEGYVQTQEPIVIVGEVWHHVGTVGEPAFENGYGNAAELNNPLRFQKDVTGRYWLSGSISPVNNGAAIFTLPSSARPPSDIGGNIVFWQNATPARMGELKIYADGSVVFWVSGNAGGSYVTVGNVSWMPA